MARVWYHIDPTTGQWEEWEAGTIPSAESCFRFEFLNQFIGWMRYIGNFTWTDESHYPTWPDRGTAKFLVGGENIQRASFWNAIGQFDPTDGTADFTNSAWKTPTDDDGDPISDLTTTGTDFTDTDLADIADYAAAKTSDYWSVDVPYVAGDVIHPYASATCRMRNMLAQARARMDMCRCVKVPWQSEIKAITHYGETNSPMSATIYWPSDVYATWGTIQNQVIGGVLLQAHGYVSELEARRTTELSEDAPHSVIIGGRRGEPFGGFSEWVGDLSAWRPAEGKIKPVFFFADPEDGEAASGTWGPTSWDGGTGGGYAWLQETYAVLLDTLPAQFTAAGAA